MSSCIKYLCRPPFVKSREGWGTHCTVCHRKAGPPALGIPLLQPAAEGTLFRRPHEV